jgi:hypothetical protein
MTNKLWVFGDSFAEVSNNFESWQLKIANELQLDLMNVSINGCSADWLMFKWNELHQQISVDDRIIIVVPFPDRVCFWPDRPSVSGIASLSSSPEKLKGISEQSKLAIKMYFTHLHNTAFSQTRINAWLQWVELFAHTAIHKPIIMHSTNLSTNLKMQYCEIAEGNIIDASINEFADHNTWVKISSSGAWLDPRTGHLSTQNHKVLADKILNFWSKSEPIDLNSGWHSAII